MAFDDLVAIDQWVIAKTFHLQNDVVTAYRNYEFHEIYQEIHNFCVVELGGFYLDIIKDRLYTTGAESAPRRSAQTALNHLAQAMVRWLAPILSFTAEEAWGHLPGIPNESVFLNAWHQFPAGAERKSAIDWPALIALKADVARELERLRTLGSLGSSMEADVTVFVPDALAAQFAAMHDELRFLLITGDAQGRELERAAGDRGQGVLKKTSGSRSSPAPVPSACAVISCARMSAAIRVTRRFARAA